MGWQPGDGRGTGEEPGLPSPGEQRPDEQGPGPGGWRHPALAGFGRGGEWDAWPPSAALTTALEAASGPGWRCPGASRDERVGMLRRQQAVESWSAAGKLGLLRDLIRDDDQPLAGGHHGDLPDGWSRSLTHEVALALAMPPQSAEKLMWTAWDLEARMPGIGALLAAGQLTFAKARAVSDAFWLLSDADAARAQALIVADLPGLTYGQAERLALQAALAVDPSSAERRRGESERNRARVALRRDPSGAASLSGYDLPTDESLAAYASVCARAGQYKGSGVFPGVRMDQFRAMAFLDLMNNVSAEQRIAAGQPPDGLGAPNQYGPEDPGPDDPCTPDDPDGGGPDPDDAGPDAGPGQDRHGRPPTPPPPSPAPTPPPPPAKPADLIIPLATLLGLAERPGEGHGLGPLDPSLCRSLAAIAAASPHTTICLTVTAPDGTATAHGCARPARNKRQQARAGPDPTSQPLTELPARLNLTITAARLRELTQQLQAGPAPPADPPPAWTLTSAETLTPAGTPGPTGGYGTWHLTMPNGATLLIKLEPVPTEHCDHRHHTPAYQPGDTLRHLVQVRDHECTFPTCSRHARESDFEHAIPHHQGGPTCACNAGARSRTCHQVKQTRGWHLTQPKPGWHQWQTPAGRTYTQGPKRYPA